MPTRQNLWGSVIGNEYQRPPKAVVDLRNSRGRPEQILSGRHREFQCFFRTSHNGIKYRDDKRNKKKQGIKERRIEEQRKQIVWNEKKHWIPHNSFLNATIDLKYNSQTNKTIQHNIKQTKQINNQPLAANVSTWLNVATRAMVPEAVREPDAAMSI